MVDILNFSKSYKDILRKWHCISSKEASAALDQPFFKPNKDIPHQQLGDEKGDQEKAMHGMHYSLRCRSRNNIQCDDPIATTPRATPTPTPKTTSASTTTPTPKTTSASTTPTTSKESRHHHKHSNHGKSSENNNYRRSSSGAKNSPSSSTSTPSSSCLSSKSISRSWSSSSNSNSSRNSHSFRSLTRSNMFSCKCGKSRSPSPEYNVNNSIEHQRANKRNSTPIVFSNSSGMSGMLKPPAIERQLECTLEELCYGCQKQIKITRDTFKITGEKVEEEEVLTIQVNPGWRKGTKITFEGKGNDKEGRCSADITFVIAEKKHSVFTREGDDLELAIKVPLVEALTGCTLSIPLLGGDNMSLNIDDVIVPGYQKIIPGQGMPTSKPDAKRADMRLNFFVAFPKQLSPQQRSDVVSILHNSC